MREFDDFAGQAMAGRQWRKLKNFSRPGDCVIAGDDPLIAKAETASQVEAVG